jgi:hypothetical protein
MKEYGTDMYMKPVGWNKESPVKTHSAQTGFKSGGMSVNPTPDESIVSFYMFTLILD